MAPIGTSADAMLPHIDEVERTHQVARKLCGPDLRPDPTWHLLGESKGNETTASRDKVLALVQLQENSSQLRRSLDRPKTCRKGHTLTPERVYVGKHGTQCRECRNTARRAA